MYDKAEWAARSRGYWIESTGLGLTLFLTVTLGALVGVVIVAQTLYSSTIEHLVDFGTVKALGGGNLTVYAIVAEQALYAAALGYGLALALAYGLAPVLQSLDMKMIVSPDAGGPGLRRHAGALRGGRVAVVSQGGGARSGDRLSRLSRRSRGGRSVAVLEGRERDEDLSRGTARGAGAPRRLAVGRAGRGRGA